MDFEKSRDGCEKKSHIHPFGIKRENLRRDCIAFILCHPYQPVMRVRTTTTLQCLDSVKKTLSQGACFAAAHGNVLIFVRELTHRRDDSGSTGAECLGQGAVLCRRDYLVNGNPLFPGSDVPVCCKLQDRVPGDAWQDGTGQGRGDQFIVDDKEDTSGGGDEVQSLQEVPSADGVVPSEGDTDESRDPVVVNTSAGAETAGTENAGETSCEPVNGETQMPPQQ